MENNEVFDINEAEELGGFYVTEGIDPRNESFLDDCEFGMIIAEHKETCQVSARSMKYSPAYHDIN
mgnify:CR=1 FL=1